MPLCCCPSTGWAWLCGPWATVGLTLGKVGGGGGRTNTEQGFLNLNPSWKSAQVMEKLPQRQRACSALGAAKSTQMPGTKPWFSSRRENQIHSSSPKSCSISPPFYGRSDVLQLHPVSSCPTHVPPAHPSHVQQAQPSNTQQIPFHFSRPPKKENIQKSTSSSAPQAAPGCSIPDPSLLHIPHLSSPRLKDPENPSPQDKAKPFSVHVHPAWPVRWQNSPVLGERLWMRMEHSVPAAHPSSFMAH